MQQALRPFMPLTDKDRALAAAFAGPDFPLDPDAVAFHKANDAHALKLQINQPQQTVEGWWAA
jgi:hypothetical protein